MTLYKLYGIAAGSLAITVGAVMVSCRKLDSIFTDNETTPNQVKRSRIIWGIFIIISGVMSISAVLFGWPGVKGYLIPPP
jgi:hypothetical protein